MSVASRPRRPFLPHTRALLRTIPCTRVCAWLLTVTDDLEFREMEVFGLGGFRAIAALLNALVVHSFLSAANHADACAASDADLRASKALFQVALALHQCVVAGDWR